MCEKAGDEQAVAACQMLLETADRIERRHGDAQIPFSPERYRQMFAISFVLLRRRLGGVVTKEFALLALAGAMGTEEPSDAQQLSDAFLRDVELVDASDAPDEMARRLLGEDYPALPGVLEELERLDGQLRAMVPGGQGMVLQAHQVITACVNFVKRAQEQRKYKFTDGKYVQYYACFLAQLVANGMALGDMGPQFFDCAAKAVGADAPSRRAAMEFKFYRTLMTCREQFQRGDPQAAERAVAFVEKGRLNADRMDGRLLQIGRKATEILQKTIADLR